VRVVPLSPIFQTSTIHERLGRGDRPVDGAKWQRVCRTTPESQRLIGGVMPKTWVWLASGPAARTFRFAEEAT
jgi:hypothetical protein